MYLLDTNVLILGLAGIGFEAKVLKKFILENKLIFSPIVIAEFLTKAEKKDQKLLGILLSRFKTASIDKTTARIAANYRKQFGRKKKTVYLADCFVAAACKQSLCALITNNTVDFPMRDIKVYKPIDISAN